MLIFCTYHSSLTPLLQFYWTKGPLRVLTNLSNFWILSIQGRPLTVFCEYVQRLALLKQLYLTDQWKQFIVNKLQKQLEVLFPDLYHFTVYIFSRSKVVVSIQLPTIWYCYWLCCFARVRTYRFHFPDDIHTLHNASKHNMFAIQPRSFSGANKKLWSIGVGASIGHR